MNTLEKSDFMEQALFFWFNDQNHIRSPFPNYIQSSLKVAAIEKFDTWLKSLNSKAKDEVSDEIIAEKFEEILFETGLNLVQTEDEKITILYPFLPRINDKVINNEKQEALVVNRNLITEGDFKFIELKCKSTKNNNVWSTKFELPQ